MPLTELLKLPDVSSAIKCDPCSVQRARLATLTQDWSAQGRIPTPQDVIKNLGWHPDMTTPP